MTRRFNDMADANLSASSAAIEKEVFERNQKLALRCVFKNAVDRVEAETFASMLDLTHILPPKETAA